ncbi:Oidioi.mRNA.OKI2018_I69.chr1.g99.t1.cds [Oikopleura dioica]|uniref:Oidioi.mRNA.OKI2018_I69.chr1.g99.t1.cds n=1 Tax=Oikopleura dioica TaxID=34765 RepID=A0ABN7SIT4_OIKDI|nr:Oidioi.mRNA.OKI2018_I69.chr1.g99.t1.cds [Oikopleura dioica]
MRISSFLLVLEIFAQETTTTTPTLSSTLKSHTTVSPTPATAHSTHHSKIHSTHSPHNTTTHVVVDKTEHPTYTACEKQWEQRIEISVGLHLPPRHHGERVKTSEIPDEAIRKLLAQELSVVAGPVCVTESQYLTIHSKEDREIKIPLHVFGNSKKAAEKIDELIILHAEKNGTEVLLDSPYWPHGAYLIDVDGVDVANLGGHRRVFGFIIFLLLISIGVIGYLVYKRGLLRRFGNQEYPGRLIAN